jgi:hypothetical protein
MRILRWTGLTIVLIAAAVVTGCVYDSPGYPGRYHRGRYYEERDGSVEGTVVRVSHRDHVIVVDPGNDGDRYGRHGRGEIVLFYDDDTTVEYQGRDYQPEDLERGDRIQASVDSRGDRRVAEHIQVVYDASNDRSNDRSEDRDRGGMAPDRPSRPDREGPGGQDEPSAADLQGTIRGVDANSHSLEIELASDDPDDDSSDAPSGVVVVHYDAQTTVQFQGRNYKPENLEEGDVVEIHVRRGRGGRPVAEQILVIGEGGQVSPSRSSSTS